MRFAREGRIAVVYVSAESAPLAATAAAALGAELHTIREDAPVCIAAAASARADGGHDPKIAVARHPGPLPELLSALWGECAGIVGVMASGILVRGVAPLVESKLADPAVVCVDAGGRFAISLLSGHEGGANSLAEDVAGAIGAQPVVTTGTEARRGVIVGVGSRRGVRAETVLAAIDASLAERDLTRAHVRALATIDLKADEPGIRQAAETLGVPVRVVGREPIKALTDALREPTFAEGAVGVPAVAVPASLLAAPGARPVLPRRAFDGVTVALAEDGWIAAHVRREAAESLDTRGDDDLQRECEECE